MAQLLTKKACEWIEFDVESFNKTSMKLLKVPENQKKLLELEKELLEEFICQNTDVNITAEKAKEIQMYMIKEEMLLMRKI